VVFPEDLNRSEVVDVHIYGQIPAGDPVEAQQQTIGIMSVDLDTLGVKRSSRTFALRVRGESMIDAHICDGDAVIMEVREPQARDIVAALIDGETTLKRYVIRDGQPYLKAENPNFPDLVPVTELLVQGVMVALIRHA
jgi:repressor LexA